MTARRQAIGLFLVIWLLYLVIGVWLAADVRWYFGDSLSRVQSAQSVLFSRDPHLSAIGFIFTPLTVIVQLPLTALTPIFPAITTSALSAAVMSSVFMAGSVVQIAGIARDRGVAPWITIAVTASYALNPMIVLYAANGMSEAPYLFFLTWCGRRLIRWIDTDDVHDLVAAGIALGFAYLTRYDGAAAALGAGIVVALVTFRRSDTTDRMMRVILDVAIVALPAFVAFIGWAFTSWLITGDLFAQLSSAYGNAAILEQSGGSGSSTPWQALRFSTTELLILAPLFPLLLAVVAIVRYRRQRFYPLLVPLVIIGLVLGFQVYSYSQGSTFAFLRFYLTVVPLAAVVALLAVPARRANPTRRPGAHASAPRIVVRRGAGYLALGMCAVITMAIAVPSTAVGMGSPTYAPQEFAVYSLGAHEDSVNQEVLDGQRVIRSFQTERSIAQYLDDLDLPDGSVLCDTVYGFAVVAQSQNPKQFVIPSDQDFTEMVNDPAAHGVRYMLSVPRSGRGESDALNVRFPTLYENGAQVGVLVLEARNVGADLPDWRIYRVTGSGTLTSNGVS
ncbi:glycosyltransferase family 39 protein [Gordonia sp. Z-3]|uniref:Glycosyltransferase family 39 protein n=1 Tax=Gordonia aquimaris TaxID=2984863 RepID=A0A9X3D141_9ACTN|nr:MULTISPECIES: glycosyltransferase family 39 protein [Gordonia]MCX2962990.1 glycosyltransferase family 39 protein [Gordonia aquimaris]MED5802036.1 glycosyltransferase family 39 protein [Gordonia sp. Z-3]